MRFSLMPRRAYIMPWRCGRASSPCAERQGAGPGRSGRGNACSSTTWTADQLVGGREGTGLLGGHLLAIAFDGAGACLGAEDLAATHFTHISPAELVGHAKPPVVVVVGLGLLLDHGDAAAVDDARAALGHDEFGAALGAVVPLARLVGHDRLSSL